MPVQPPFGIAKRLYAVSFLLILALAGLAVQTWLQLGEVADLARKTGEVRVQQLARVAEIELNVTQVSLQIRHAMLVKTPADLASTLAYIGDKRQHMDASFNTYSSLVQSPAGRAGVEQLSQMLKTFWEIGGANIALIQASQKDEAFQFLVDKTIPTRNRLLAALNAEKVRQSALLTAELGQIQGNALSSRNWLVGMAIVVALGLLAFAWHISSVLQRRVALSQQVVERVRNGDLTQPVRDAANDEFSPLLRSMDGMQQALTDMVRGVRTGAESVSSASAEIAQGNQDLSNRTESQASALEQTAASMEQLNSTVQQNADNAAQANQLAMLSSNVAIEGGEVVSKVVQTMKGINESSQKIADIIGVIDSIAFQTNILALNAAVEAARAGEQGRGFAVVASEVRSLAGRSAEAAKEIKTLISASVERVAQGTQLVDQAGATMTEVVGSIRRVTDIMGEISAASTEQSKGVAQVGEAVTQMDHSTQQNAALVEQMAAAANSLRHQAQELVDVASVFKLAGGSSAVARL